MLVTLSHDAYHICCCPVGSMPVDGSSRKRTGGSPRMLSTKHSCNTEKQPCRRPLEMQQSSIGSAPTITHTCLAVPVVNFCTVTFSCSRRSKASTNLVEKRMRRFRQERISGKMHAHKIVTTLEMLTITALKNLTCNEKKT